MSVNFHLAPTESGERPEWTGVFVDVELIDYFARLGERLDVVGIGNLDPFGTVAWPPDDANDRERRFRNSEKNSTPFLVRERAISNHPDQVGQFDNHIRSCGRWGVKSLVAQLATVCAVAAERDLWVLALGD